MRRNRIISDDECSMGTGALIVFVAMVMLATIITFTLINITEKLSQHTQQASEDVRRNSVNTVVITGAWVYDNQDDMLFLMEFGGAGDPVERLDVHYVLTCSEPDGTFFYRSAALGDANGGQPIFVWKVGDTAPEPPDNNFPNVDNFEPGARYFFTLDGGTSAVPGGAQCGPVHLDTHGIDANLYIHIPNGQSTHQVLTLSNGREVGSQLI